MARILLSLWLALAGCAAALAEEQPANENLTLTSGEPVQCLTLARIDEVEVVDERTVLFHMLGKEVYLNDLPYRCPGLSRHDTLMYRSSVPHLCNVDIITVLDSVGFGYSPGVSCGLGMFYPISAENATTLKARARKKP